MDKSTNLTLGNNVRRYRQLKGYSQSQLAELLMCDRSYVNKLEQGEHISEVYFISQLAQVLDVLPAQLFQDIDQIFATQVGQDIIIEFPYDKFTAQYHLADATTNEFESVTSILRDGLSSSNSKSEVVANAFLYAVQMWPHANPSDVWTFVINRAYCDRSNHPTTEHRLNLEQSWKRTSGWALERVMVKHYNPFLKERGIALHLNKRHLLNDIDDPRVISDKADVLVLRTTPNDKLLGVVHVKASLAERRTDDVPMSQALIDAGLLSIFWTMDVKSLPSNTPINRGEFGQVESEGGSSDKRRDFEIHGHFSACFSYNSNTVPTPETSHVAAKIHTCNFKDPADAFTDFLLSHIEFDC